MLYLITGQPGNGKTLRAMALMRDEYERNQAAVKAGKEQPRRFFSNVKGATLDENPKAFPWVERLPDHNDWTQLPDSAYVQYDEAHSDGKTPGLERYGKLFPSTGKPGESEDQRIRAMSTHRHRGVDIVLITQWPSKIHHQVRTLVGKHIHMNRAMGIAAAGTFTWTRVQTDPYDEKGREAADEEIWSYDKTLYDRYISATHHTAAYKFKMPKKIKNGLITGTIIMAMIAAVFTYNGWWGAMLPGLGGQGAGQAQAQPGEAGAAPPGLPPMFQPNAPNNADAIEVLMPGYGAYSELRTTPTPTLAGCVRGRTCRCFNTDGLQIDMTRQQCERLLADPLPFNVYHPYRETARERPESLARAPSAAIPDQPPATTLRGGSAARYGDVHTDYGDYGISTGRYVGQGIAR
ncbi:zonular occludens toxin domain-containing protein [Luteimonas sp. RC10]|uniref:zonular occludens toxin domain-containing protein n=1 Tax=Luteimonas sp. RC10 TaxID=2587035 RepID=UPI0016205B10|nr:zonular occludens toxin domain-containing protein [Luteimonas sp. RC10]MBB3344512.1 hypothetical protein [Luteimonas sp. RC10]